MGERWPHALISFVFLVALFLGCGRDAPAAPKGLQATDAQSSTPAKRIVAAIRGNPYVLYHKLNVGNNFIGTNQLERLVNAGLTAPDGQGMLHPQLAEAVPSIENGLWNLFPDGRMETTWRIRQNAMWHDGAPLTTEDVLFTARVEQDRELQWVWNSAYDAVEGIDTLDVRTVRIRWKRPFIEADAMFASASQRGLPLPGHILQRAYEDDRAAFLQLPYWSHQFVGSGPFQLREWAPDAYLILEAYPGYVQGRPKIDEIEIRLVPDTNTIIANILAGAVEYTIDGRSINLEEARNLQAQWREGRMELGTGGVVTIFPQFLNPSPAIVADAQFRRALMHAMDRQEMVDSIQAGVGGVAHTYLGPDQREYQKIESSIVSYAYDPRRAAQLMEGIGYARGADGFFRDAASQRLSIPLHTTVTVINQKATLAVSDYWQKAGFGVETTTIPLQRQSDREFMFTLPAFHLIRIGRSITSFQSLRSAEAPLPENTFAGSNRGRYRSRELDALIERYFVTIPRPERMQILGQIIHHETDNLPLMRVFFDPEATMVGNRLRNVPGGTPWNAVQWEIS